MMEQNLFCGDCLLSPDKEYFLTSQLDLEAGCFVANSFQFWSVENKKPLLRWEKELYDWGAGKVIWTRNSCGIGEQTYRNYTTDELKNRFIKMRIVWSNVK